MSWKIAATALLLSARAAGAHAAEASGCDMKDSEVKAVAMRYLTKKIPAASHNWRYEVTSRNGTIITVVASPLPVTPDASVILLIQCAVHELSDTPA